MGVIGLIIGVLVLGWLVDRHDQWEQERNERLWELENRLGMKQPDDYSAES